MIFFSSFLSEPIEFLGRTTMEEIFVLSERKATDWEVGTRNPPIDDKPK